MPMALAWGSSWGHISCVRLPTAILGERSMNRRARAVTAFAAALTCCWITAASSLEAAIVPTGDVAPDLP